MHYCFFAHFLNNLGSIYGIKNLQYSLWGAGKIGVAFFFALCGYLNTKKYLIQEFDNISMGEYLLKKSVRIYIPLAVVAFLGLFVHFETYSEFIQIIEFKAFPGHFWTIPIEFTYYIFLLLFIIISKHLNLNCLYQSIFTIIVAIVSFLLFTSKNRSGNEQCVAWYLPVFCIAMLIALSENEIQLFIKKRQIICLLFDFVGIVSLIILICYMPAINSIVFGTEITEASQQIMNMYMIFGILADMVLLGIVNGKYMKRLFDSLFFFSKIGITSYSIYLIHPIVIQLLDNMKVSIMWFIVLTIILTIILSCLLYIFIEKHLCRYISLRLYKYL